jgi:Ca-activated chloride channel family protein
MPSQGSRVDLGLEKAGHLLRQAGLRRGDILLVTDGYNGQRAVAAAAKLRQQDYRVSVLGVGTTAGAPVPVSGGGFLRDNRGEIVIPALDPQALQALAAAGGGHYATISSGDADIRRLLMSSVPGMDEMVASNDHSTDQWRSHGALIILMLLPLAALAFRRGWLLLVLVTVSATVSMPQPAMAVGWDDLWLRPDQQATRALQAGNPNEAARLADDPALRGTAAYQAGDYEQALDAFGGAVDIDADYNQGNALANLGRYEEAIAAYDRALEKQPGMADAVHNRAEVEKQLQQQQQQQQQDQQNQQDQQDQQDQQQSANADQQDQSGQEGEQGEGESQDNSGEQDQQQQQDEAAGEQQQAADANAGEDAEKEPQSAKQETGDEGEAGDQQTRTAEAEPLDSEEQQAAEQWLRRIPDDPGGLLRRKFLYQYRQQAQGTADADQQAW